MGKRKILAVASIGGHWVQLLRISRSLENKYDVVYLSTHPKCSKMVEGNKYYLIQDFSRWDAWKLIPSLFRNLYIILKERPDAIITTGAAPGLICLFAGKLLFKKTIWIDSIANVQNLSASGRIASKFASKVYTQWKDLSNDKIIFAGSVLGEI
jgi:UDP-N-acetylglucosamine:LPS N-acetylglucosamine transferase